MRKRGITMTTMKINRYKDQCDQCNKFDYLISYDGKCLCSKCYKKQMAVMVLYQLSIFEANTNTKRESKLKDEKKCIETM